MLHFFFFADWHFIQLSVQKPDPAIASFLQHLGIILFQNEKQRTICQTAGLVPEFQLNIEAQLYVTLGYFAL